MSKKINDVTADDSSRSIARSVLSRRTVIKGSAWAAPVIAVAVASPAAAASQGDVASIRYLSTTIGGGDLLVGQALDSMQQPVAGVTVSFDIQSGSLAFTGDQSVPTDTTGTFFAPIESTLQPGAGPETGIILVTVGSLATEPITVTVLPED
ncbi:hypothetical protein [Compostimonas suwonensis]|uniref:Ig-like domain-containing protein n=1 Tax=Compostimonas suwonensis TaxID=1048394 RepID=A0A2M9C596_9MICO|nr:hypothetical protein [Compostimonas suwonensis]PJJ65647.1 hypothetical protein CLV54_0684 [Compostimonas suwonensis]